MGAGWTAWGAGMGGRPSGGARARPDGEDRQQDLLDQGFERLQALYPHADMHRGNHVPMVVEALCVLGRADAIAPWMDENLGGERPALVAERPIDTERWRELVGRSERFSDWRALFLRELASEDWPAVIRRWVPRLVPGLAGSATHGVIRTAHVVRALGVRDCEVRRRELATGLAYWAAGFEQLPWDGSQAPEASVAAALARVQPRLPALEPPRGNIVSGLRALGETPSFAPVAGLVDTRDPARTLSEMATCFASLYLANPERRIAFTHSITAPSALRLLAPHLDEETVRRATLHAWQAAAGLFVVYGDPRKRAATAGEPLTRAELADRAVANGGAHSIKLTEACLREEALSHDAGLLLAASDAARELNG